MFAASDFQLATYRISDFAVYSIIVLGVSHVVALGLGAYDLVWRYVGRATFGLLFVRACLTGAGVVFFVFLYDRLVRLPRLSLVPLLFGLYFGWLVPRVLYALWARRVGDASRPGAAWRRPVLLVGAGPLAAAFADWFAHGAGGGWYAVGILDDGIDAGRRLGRLPVLGRLADARRVFSLLRLRGEAPQRILVTGDPRELDRRGLQVVQEVAYAERVPIRFAHRLLGIAPTAPVPPVQPALTVEPARWIGLRALADSAVAALALLFTSPLLLLAVLALLPDPGRPLVFGQTRLGRGFVPFRLFKLRTMRDGVDGEGRIALPDQRLTPAGTWVRRLRIDELLQLWNVVRGEMALIGPRPLVLEDVLDMPEQGRGRFVVRPGITGWAQVNGGNDLTPEEKYAMDLWYIAHASPALDLRIVWRTLRTVFRGERRDEQAIAAALAWYRLQRAGIGDGSREAAA